MAKEDRAAAPLEVTVGALETGLTITALGLLMHLLARGQRRVPLNELQDATGEDPARLRQALTELQEAGQVRVVAAGEVIELAPVLKLPDRPKPNRPTQAPAPTKPADDPQTTLRGVHAARAAIKAARSAPDAQPPSPPRHGHPVLSREPLSERAEALRQQPPPTEHESETNADTPTT